MKIEVDALEVVTANGRRHLVLALGATTYKPEECNLDAPAESRPLAPGDTTDDCGNEAGALNIFDRARRHLRDGS